MMELWQVYGIFFLIGLILYTWKIQFLTLQLNPFGVSTTLLNSYLDRFGSKYSQIFQSLGRNGYNIFGWFSIILTLSGLFWSISLFVGNLIPIPQINFFTFINPYWEVDFSSLTFWGIVVISIFLHEFMHGFAAGAYQVPIKTVGMIIIPTVLYGGYVNVDFDSVSETPVDPTDETSKRIQEIKSMVGITDLNRFDEIISEKKSKIVGVTACGMYANIFLLLMGLLLHTFFPQQWLKYLISSNILLIILNLLPILISDGSKLFQFKISEIFPKSLAAKINHFFTTIIWLLLFPLILY